MSSSVARLHRTLVVAMHRNRPNAPNGTVTVAEIYQDLVPYRSVRSALGFALNADYEHALLQLLAGVDGLARIEPAEAREALRLELESPNPNTGVFRGYAACDVIITPLDDLDATELEEPTAPAETGWSTPAEVLHAVHGVESYAGDSGAATPAASPGKSEALNVDSRATAGPIAAYPIKCRACGNRLPTDRAVRFCPQCGEDQQAQKCSSCGEQLEAGWKYCITCGEGVHR